MRLTDPLLNPFLYTSVAFFGGKPKAPKPVKIPKQKPMEMPAMPPMPKIEMPKPISAEEMAASMPKPVPPTPVPPPPTTSPLEAQEASDEQMRKQQARRGMSASIIAGEQDRDYVSSATGTGSLLG